MRASKLRRIPLMVEKKRKETRGRIQGDPLTGAERKILVENCQRHKTKRQVNLGTSLFGIL